MAKSIRTYIQTIGKQFKKTYRTVKTSYVSSAGKERLNDLPYIVRRVSPADKAQLFQMHQRLSKVTLYYRNLAAYRPTTTDMETICTFAVSEGTAFVAQRRDPNGTIIGLAYYCCNSIKPHEKPQFTIVVEDRFQGHGVGKDLLKHLCRHAAAMGIKQLSASIHPQNARMRHLLNRTGYPFDGKTDGAAVKAIIHLQPATPVLRHTPFYLRNYADPLAGLNFEIDGWRGSPISASGVQSMR